MTTAETTAAATQDTPAEKPADTRALLKTLQEHFEVFRNFSPLAIGIDKQLLAQQPELNRKALRLALRSHTQSTRYLKEMEKAHLRRNLDGTEAGEVTAEARSHSAELLRERFKKQAEQRKADEAAARAEARRLEKLSQLTEKFGRKAK